MSNCSGLHCPDCRGSGRKKTGFLVVAGIVAAVVHHYWPVIVEAVQIAAWTVLSAGGAAALGYVSLAIARAIQDRPRQVSYRRVRKHQPAPYTITKVGTGATPQHKELADRMNDDLARQAAHLTGERVYTSR